MDRVGSKEQGSCEAEELGLRCQDVGQEGEETSGDNVKQHVRYMISVRFELSNCIVQSAKKEKYKLENIKENITAKCLISTIASRFCRSIYQIN